MRNCYVHGSGCQHEHCAPYSECKDQTVGPPWYFDEHRMQIWGTKLRTRGCVTVLQLSERRGEELYYPTRDQALEFGRAMVLNMNRMNVRMPDRDHEHHHDTGCIRC